MLVADIIGLCCGQSYTEGGNIRWTFGVEVYIVEWIVLPLNGMIT